MSYVEDWRALSARIHAVGEAAQFFMFKNTTDSFGSSGHLIAHCKDIAAELAKLQIRHQATLPQTVKERLRVSADARALKELENNTASVKEFAGAILVLKLIESEITYLLADSQEIIRRISYRSFQHLQRTLAVDEHTSKAWQKAFDEDGETGCEKLGGVHLLLHGIYAFKVHADGARTDLVFNEPINLREVERGSDGLVLTEWKLAKEANVAPKKFAEAKAQARIYQETALGGIELRSHRFLIVVTPKQLSLNLIPADEIIDGVIHHCINIAIAPNSPSVQAAKATQKTQRK